MLAEAFFCGSSTKEHQSREPGGQREVGVTCRGTTRQVNMYGVYMYLTAYPPYICLKIPRREHGRAIAWESSRHCLLLIYLTNIDGNDGVLGLNIGTPDIASEGPSSAVCYDSTRRDWGGTGEYS